MRNRVRRLLSAGRLAVGASLVEYALLIALVAVVSIGAISFLSRETVDTLSSVGSAIN